MEEYGRIASENYRYWDLRLLEYLEDNQDKKYYILL